MRITAFIGAAVLGLCMLAMSPAAMADPAPDICILEMTQPTSVNHALVTAPVPCAAIVAEVAIGVSPRGDKGGPAASCNNPKLTALDYAGHRQHEDPGRCLS